MTSQLNKQTSLPVDTRERRSFFYQLGYWTAQHHWLVIVTWLILLVGSGFLFPQLFRSLTIAGFTVGNSESEQVATSLKTRFAQQFDEQDLVVFHSTTLTVNDTAYRQVIYKVIAELETKKGVAAVFSPLSTQATGQVSQDGHAAFGLIGVKGNDDQRLDLAGVMAGSVSNRPNPQVETFVTGFSPMTADLADQESRDLEQVEIFGLPLALVVLLVAFGTVVAALLPVPLALCGLVLTFGLLALISLVAGHLSLVVENMVSMIGLGVGIDYSLFVVTRFREELLKDQTSREAVAGAIATAGKTIFFSGTTVVIALSGLFLVDSKVFTDLALGAILIVATMVLITLTLLPALLDLLGQRVNSLKIPFLKNSASAADLEHGFWARWAGIVMRRPVVWIILVTGLILAATVPVFNLKLGIDYSTASLADRPSGKGLAILGRYFSQGDISPVQILVETPGGAFNDAQLEQVAKLSEKLRNDLAVARVESLTDILDQYAGGHSQQALESLASQAQSASLLGYYINLERGSNLSLINVVPKVAMDSPQAGDLVNRIRSEYAPQVAGLKVLVGGTTAENTDLSNEVMAKLPLVLGLVLGLSFLVLLIAFRSLFLPLKAIVMNLFSIGASFGLLVLVFQLGAGEKVLNFHSPGTIEVYLPMLAFAMLFGLSMDYEVFLIGRMKEEWRTTGNNEKAVAYGLEHTAKVITSAAAIMVTVFAAFTFASALEIKQLGFSLAVAVLVDATLIRVLLVPAAMRVMGKWNWWLPGFLDRLLPRFEL